MDINSENVVSDLVFKQLQLDATNAECFDCGQAQPQWASVNNGTFICMQCAALHKQMGMHVSIVRSLSMDTWNMNQLKQMALGGNKKLKEYFQNYDLNDESVQQRYNTRAAEYYRLKLRSQCEGIPFGDKQPSYEIGREQIPPDEIRQMDEIMAQQMQKEHETQGNAYGPDYYSYFTSFQEKATYAASVAKTKAGDLSQNEKVQAAQASLLTYGSKAQDKIYNAGSSIQQSYQDGTLKDKAKENAGYAYTSLSGFGSSLYAKAATLTGQQMAQAESQGQGQPAQQMDNSNQQEDLLQFNQQEQAQSNQPPKQQTEGDLIDLNNKMTNL